MRQPDADSSAYGNADCDRYIHSDGNGNCDGHIHSDSNRDGNGAFANTDGNSNVDRDRDRNRDRTSTAYADATASTVTDATGLAFFRIRGTREDELASSQPKVDRLPTPPKQRLRGWISLARCSLGESGRKRCRSSRRRPDTLIRQLVGRSGQTVEPNEVFFALCRVRLAIKLGWRLNCARDLLPGDRGGPACDWGRGRSFTLRH